LAKRAATILGGVVFIVQLTVWLPQHANRADTARLDFSTYYGAAVNVASGQPLYRECERYAKGDLPSCYLYPPPLAAMLAPLASFGAQTFQVVWYAAILVAFWVYAFALVRLAQWPTTIGHVLIAGVVVQLTPGTQVTMSFGNADFMIWALCALALPGSRLFAGIGAAIKIYPGWLLIVSLARRERNVIAGIAAMAVTIGATSWALSLRSFRDWSAALAILASGPRVPGNVSLPVGIVRLAERRGYVADDRPFLLLVPLLGVLAVLFATRRRSREVQGALILMTSVLLSPLCWWYYAPMLLMVGAALLGQRRSSGSRPSPVTRGGA
jgi:hypothetical protein